ncbi:MAG: glycosyltransferase family 39 protein [Nitrospiraceae bacterium]|nr:MAG: glycosyltransferase family 39 protein [Nitrospiraceae bacterium]
MADRRAVLKNNYYVFIISLLTLCTFITLYVSREIDDNRLTSWNWVFQHVHAQWIFLVLLAGVLFSTVIARISLQPRYSSVILFVLAFLTSAVFWSMPETIIDTSRYFTQAKHIALYGVSSFFHEWGTGLHAWTDMPLTSFLYGLIFRFCGENRMFIQIFTTLLFSLTAVLTYEIGRELWDRDTGFFGGVLLLGMPYLFSQIPLMLVDIPSMFFLFLSIFVFIKTLRSGGTVRIVVAAITIVLAFFVKYSTWLMLSVLPVVTCVFVLEHWPLKPGRILYRTLIIGAVSGVVIGAIVFFKLDLFSSQLDLLMTYQKPGLKRWTESFISTFLFQIHPFITASALVSLYVAFKKRDLRYLIIFWLVLLVIIMQIKRIRYIVLVFPMVALMASYALQKIGRRDIKKYLVACIVTTSLIIGIFGFLPFLRQISMVNLKHAGSYLNSITETDIAVFTVLPEDPAGNFDVTVPILDLFTRKNIVYVPDDRRRGEQTEEIETSSLRFTWEYEIPSYYYGDAFGKNMAIVVISEDAGRELPAYLSEQLSGYQLAKVYDTYEGIFRFKTMVRIFRYTGE